MKTLHLVAALLFSFSLLFAADHTYAKGETDASVAAVETKSESKKSSTTKSSAKLPLGTIGINSADKAELVKLPGVGPKTADAILDYRKTNGNFNSVDELVNVKGIGKKSLEKLKPFLKV